MVWCTGYNKLIRLLSRDGWLDMVEEGRVLEPLYLHCININYPSMAVLNINPGNVPFRQMDLQVHFKLI